MQNGCDLPQSASPAATRDAAPECPSATAKCTGVAVERAATEVAESPAAVEPAIIIGSETPVTWPVIAAVAMEPRTRAEKDAAIEIFGAVISVRRAGVRVITVIPIGAVGSGTHIGRRRDVPRTHSNADAKSYLSVSHSPCQHHKKPEQACIF